MAIFRVLLVLLFSVNAVAGEPGDVGSESIEQGRQLFMQHCTTCHGEDGRAQVDVIADATDLTETAAYYSGSDRKDVFTSIKDGAGVSMPPFSFQFKDEEDIWRLVDFVLSLQEQ